MMNIALKQEQFIVYYQPQYNHSTKKIVGAEALVRWVHPEKGIISPARFIPVFEKNGFISNLDLYVFERACQFVRYCMDNGISVVPVSTNLTRYDIFSSLIELLFDDNKFLVLVESSFISVIYSSTIFLVD